MIKNCFLLLFLIALPSSVLAANGPTFAAPYWLSWSVLAIFVLAYILVMFEETIHLRKSKPVVLAAGIIWALVAWGAMPLGQSQLVTDAFRHGLGEYAELMLFLMVAMTYINVIEERGVFLVLRDWLLARKLNSRALFWITGILSFFISAIADNLTTSLMMGAVVLAVAGRNKKFAMVACVNVVVACNAGGAFSPFGDVTTLMVWQKNIISTNGALTFFSFFNLFIPSLVNWLVPAFLMHWAVPKQTLHHTVNRHELKNHAWQVVGLFVFTIALSVTAHSVLHLPPVLGMLTGLGMLNLYNYRLKRRNQSYDVFGAMAQIEWDTLLFFYGILMAMAALSLIGHLHTLSTLLYGGFSTTVANIGIGIISAIVDNVPVMFAVLNMQPPMSSGQWLLATLATGVGGSLLSIGSAAGVALMGQARGAYTFAGHLRWLPVITLGYFASMLTHLWLNQKLF